MKHNEEVSLESNIKEISSEELQLAGRHQLYILQRSSEEVVLAEVSTTFFF